MVAPVILVEATPRRAADGLAVTVRLAGGGAVAPYFYTGQHYRAGVTGLPKSTASLDFDGEQLGGGGVAQALEIGWAPATNAALGELADLFWKDAAITVRVGPEGDALPPITAAGLVLEHAVDDGTLRIALADQAADLKRAVLVDRFAGTGGIEGPAEWEGKIRSRAWGRCFNVPGECIDTANNIWCFGDPSRPWLAFDQVRDMGVFADQDDLPVLAWQGSAAATFAALQAAGAPDGGGVRCPSIASVKWWTQPAGDLHADIRGETAYGYVETAPEIATRLVAARSALPFAAGAVLDAVAARPAPFGWRVDNDGTTAAGELSELLAGVSLSWLIVDGAIEFRRWEWTAPVRVARSETVRRKQVYAAVATRKLGYRRNWDPMARGELAAVVLSGEVELPPDIEAAIAAAATTATWTGVSSRPDNLAALAGGENINNATVSIGASGALAGGGGGQVTIGGLGYVGALNATYGAAWTQNISGLPYNLSILSGGESINNIQISIGANGALSGGGGGQVTIRGVGYRGDLDAGTTLTFYDYQAIYTVTGNSFVKSSGAGWNANLYTREFSVGSALLSAEFTSRDTFIGISIDGQNLDSSFTQLEFGVHASGNGHMYIYEGGQVALDIGVLSEVGIWVIGYDGTTVRYYHDGAFFYQSTQAVQPGWTVYAGFNAYTVGGGVKNIQFGPLNGATWGSNVANRPGNLSVLAGSESINNTYVSISSAGVLAGGGGGQVTIGGLGYGGDLNATFGASWGYNVAGRPSNLAGLGGGESILNVQVSIGANGALSGGGGGQVSLGGLGAGWGATAGQSQADNSFVAAGNNALPNSDQITCTWQAIYAPAAVTLGPRLAAEVWGTDSFTLSGSPHNVAASQGAPIPGGDDATGFDLSFCIAGGGPAKMAVSPGDRIIGSCYIASHRCKTMLYLSCYGADGSGTVTPVGTVRNATDAPANALSEPYYHRHAIVATIAAGTISVALVVRKFNTLAAEGNSYIWVAGPMLERANANQTDPSPYVAGPSATTRELGYLGDLNATFGASWGASLSGRPGNLSTLGGAEGIQNTLVSISAGGAMSGAGGGQVTIGGLGYSGALNATFGATWNVNLGGAPANLTALGGGEAINNAGVSITASGALAGGGGGQVTIGGLGYLGDLDAQSNGRLSIVAGKLANNGSPLTTDIIANAFVGITAGYYLTTDGGVTQGAAIVNAGVSISASGALSGGGGGQVTLGGIGFAGDTDAERNSRIYISASVLYGIGTGAGTPVANVAISISASGALSGGGGGQVTLPGIGFSGETDADNTSRNQHSLVAPSDINVQADYTGAIGAGELPRSRTINHMVGNNQVDAAIAAAATSGVAITVNNTAGDAQRGTITVTSGQSLPAEATISGTSTYAGVALPFSFKVYRLDAAPPSSPGSGGGGGSTPSGPASVTSFTPPGPSASYVELARCAAVTTGSGGAVSVAAPLSYYEASEGPFGGSGPGDEPIGCQLQVQAQYSTNGGSTWSNAGSAVLGSYAYHWFKNTPPRGNHDDAGSLSVSTNITGLGGGASVIIRIIGEVVGGYGGADDIVTVMGQMTATPS